MFSERWICFCCPQVHKIQRSIVPIDQAPQTQKNKLKKKSDISEHIIYLLTNKYAFFLL